MRSRQHDAGKTANRVQKLFNAQGRVGESDRVIGTKMPKHLYSGKRGLGTSRSR